MTRFFRCLICITLSVSFFFLSACGSTDKKGQTGKRPVPVTLAKAQQQTIARTLEAVGNVQPVATVAVKPQVGGQIIEAPVKSGQDVEKGQVLFRLDPRPFEAAVNEVKARLLRDQVLLKKAEEDRERFARLVRQDAISREQYDQAVTNAASQRAAVTQDEATLASARLQLEYATIRAPMAGRVGEVLIDAGNVVKANDDRTLLVINALAPAKITFAVPERYLPEIMEEFRKGTIEVRATPEGDMRAPAKGALTSIDNSVDKTTGTIRLEALFPNEDMRLWPGQFTRIRVELAEMQNAIVVPAAAVLEGISGPYAYVVKSDNTVEVRLLTTSRAPDNRLIVLKGLAEGEILVLDGQLNLTPGALISAKNPELSGGQGNGGAASRSGAEGGKP